MQRLHKWSVSNSQDQRFASISVDPVYFELIQITLHISFILLILCSIVIIVEQAQFHNTSIIMLSQ